MVYQSVTILTLRALEFHSSLHRSLRLFLIHFATRAVAISLRFPLIILRLYVDDNLIIQFI